MRLISPIFGVFVAAVTFSALAADSVVVASNAPGITPGQNVKADEPLQIPKSASVTLVFESGKTLTVKGPHSGPMGAVGEGGGDGRLLTALTDLLLGSGRETEATGAMRQDAIPASPPDPWVIDIGRAGDHCVPAGGPVKLWRAAKTRNLLLKNLADKSKSVTDWPAETNTLEWPSQVTLDGGTEYLARVKGSRNPTRFVVHLVPADLPSDAHRAVWMADKGCVEQAKRLLTLLR